MTGRLWLYIGACLLVISVAVGINLPYSLINHQVYSSPTVRIKAYNLYKQQFKEPFEKVLFIMPNFNVLEITTNHDDCVSITCDRLLDEVRKRNIELSQVMIIIHNHNTPNGFSFGDLNCYRYFKTNGFRGYFGVFIKPLDKIIFLKD